MLTSYSAHRLRDCLGARCARRQNPVALIMITAYFSFISTGYAVTLASDAATDPAYASNPVGAWQGTGPTVDENTPGTDDGGSGFQPWDFRGGYHDAAKSPYGHLNHFIDGIDFAHSLFNDLGTTAFALTNTGSSINDGYFGYTSRATRTFDTPLAIGQTLSINFDNPLPQPLNPFVPAGFVIRLNKGGGPVVDSDPLPGVTDRFNLIAASNFNEERWYVVDSEPFIDTGIAPGVTAVGTNFTFTLTGAESYAMEFRRLSDNQLVYARTGALENSGAGPIDSIELTLYRNGSSSTGSREFFFNSIQITGSTIADLGDYNRNGVVDAGDYVVWRDSLGQNVSSSTGADGDGNGTIDEKDYDVWRAHYASGSTAAIGAESAVPEPTFLLMICECFVILESHYLTYRRHGVFG